MNKLAKDELIAGKHTTLEDLIAEINRMTEQQVFETAQTLFISDRMALTGLGPLSSRQVAELSTKFL
jgi:predicted Zn-dependent peptidase